MLTLSSSLAAVNKVRTALRQTFIAVTLVSLFLTASVDTAYAQTNAPPAPTTASAPVTVPVSEKMRAEFFASIDHKAFVDQALKRPGEGGFHYAMLALTDCTRWDLYKPITPVLNNQQQGQRLSTPKPSEAALARQQIIDKQCAGFSKEEALRRFVNTHYGLPQSSTNRPAELGNQTDPLMQARLQLEQSIDQIKQGKPASQLLTQLKSQFRQLQQLQDPTVPTHQLLTQIAVRATHDSTIWLDGVHYGNDVKGDQPNRRAIESMIELAVCDGQTDCSIDRGMREICALLNECYTNQVEFALNVYLNKSPRSNEYGLGTATQFDAALKLLPAIKSHLASANIQAFLPPPHIEGDWVASQQHLVRMKLDSGTVKPEPTLQEMAQSDANELGASVKNLALNWANSIWPTKNTKSEISKKNATRPDVAEKMHAAYLASNDHYAFIEYALRRSSEGGLGYAFVALRDCQLVAQVQDIRNAQINGSSVFSLDDSLEPLRQKLYTRCARFTKPSEMQNFWFFLNRYSEHLRWSDPLLASFDALNNEYWIDSQRQMTPQVASYFKKLTRLKHSERYVGLFLMHVMYKPPLKTSHGGIPQPIWFDGSSYERTAIKDRPSSLAITQTLWYALCKGAFGCSDMEYFIKDCVDSEQCKQKNERHTRRRYLSLYDHTDAQIDAAFKLLPKIKVALERANTMIFKEPIQPHYKANQISASESSNSLTTKYPSVHEPILIEAIDNMRKKLLTSKNYREFMLYALTRPQEGGVFYAQQVAYLCTRSIGSIDSLIDWIQSTNNPKGTLNNKRIEAFKQVKLQCSSFSEISAFDLFDSTLYKTDNKELDPLWRIQAKAVEQIEQIILLAERNPLGNAKTFPYEANLFAAQIKTNLQKALALRQPTQNFARAIFSTGLIAANDTSIWINGVQYKQTRFTNEGQLYRIQNMTIHAVCDAHSCNVENEMLRSCATFGVCCDSIFEEISPWYERIDHPARIQRDLNLYRQIKEQIDRGNLDAFMPPRKKKH